jgi:hypothetical protein
MLISKTLKCKVFKPTQKKLELLNQEYLNFQIFVRSGRDLGVYSLTKSTFDFKHRKKFEVLLTEKREGSMADRTQTYKQVILKEGRLGEFVKVKIYDATACCLKG